MRNEHALIQEAQAKIISQWLLEHYAGGGRRIAKWDDHHYYLSSFSPNSIVAVPGSCMTYAAARRLCARMEHTGFITRQSGRGSRHLRYRLPREHCDLLAITAIQHWKEEGYSQDEIRLAKVAA